MSPLYLSGLQILQHPDGSRRLRCSRREVSGHFSSGCWWAFPCELSGERVSRRGDCEAHEVGRGKRHFRPEELLRTEMGKLHFVGRASTLSVSRQKLASDWSPQLFALVASHLDGEGPALER